METYSRAAAVSNVIVNLLAEIRGVFRDHATLSEYGVEYLDSGCTRWVYGDREYVYKVGYATHSRETNRREYDAYHAAVKNFPELGNLLAPVVHITECGRVLVMERAEMVLSQLIASAYNDTCSRRISGRSNMYREMLRNLEYKWNDLNREYDIPIMNVENDLHSGNVAFMPDGMIRIIDYGGAWVRRW